MLSEEWLDNYCGKNYSINYFVNPSDDNQMVHIDKKIFDQDSDKDCDEYCSMMN